MSTNMIVRLTTAMCGVAALVTMIFCVSNGQSTDAQTLPDPSWDDDSIQYFAPGPEFKLSRETAAKKADQADLEAQLSGQ